MPSLIDLLTALRTALDQTRQLIAGIGSSSDLSTQARDQATALGTEGAAANLGHTVDNLDESRAQAAAIEGRLEAAIAAVEAARTGTGSAGGGGGAPPSTPPTAPSPPSEPDRPWSNHPPVPGFRPDRPHPVCIEETRRVGWPVNRNGRVSARGRLFDSDGRPITGTVQAGSGPANHVTDLSEPWASDTRMTTRWHIEGHAAAVMRRHDLKESVLYINIPPCGSEQQDEWRCDSNIAKILPQGSTLRVWVARQNGTISRFIYRGTGEGVQ